MPLLRLTSLIFAGLYVIATLLPGGVRGRVLRLLRLLHEMYCPAISPASA